MVFDQNEDLFEETKMSFGDHLEELRVVIVRALIGLVIGFGIALLFASQVVSYLQRPLKAAISDFMIQQAKEDLRNENDGIVPPELELRLNEDRLTPKKFKVNPEVLLSTLAPYLGDDVVNDVEFESPYSFQLSQLKPEKTQALCEHLAMVAKGEKSDSRATVLWSKLNVEEQTSLQNIAEKEEAAAADKRTVVDILNRLATDPELHQDEAFSNVFAGQQKEGFVGWLNSFFQNTNERNKALRSFRDTVQKDQDPTTVRRLNNWLISISLADYVDKPYLNLDEITIWESTEVNPQALNAHEVFMIYIKAALITGLVISSPWVFYQIWTFVAAGLYPHERRYVYLYLPLSLGLFLGGIFLAFFFVFEPVLGFLFKFNAAMGIDPQPRIGEWLSFVMFLPIGFGIAFQLPLVMLFLHRLGLVSIEQFLDKWRIAVLIIFFLSMILTPADPISMILLAFPLTILYFFGIGLCRWMPKGRNPFSEGYEPS